MFITTNDGIGSFDLGLNNLNFYSMGFNNFGLEKIYEIT